MCLRLQARHEGGACIGGRGRQARKAWSLYGRGICACMRPLAGSGGDVIGGDLRPLCVCGCRYAMREALALVGEEGLEPMWERHQRLHEDLWKGLRDMGLEPFVQNPDDRLATVNTIKVCLSFIGPMLHRILRSVADTLCMPAVVQLPCCMQEECRNDCQGKS